jgi:hypothetical protein
MAWFVYFLAIVSLLIGLISSFASFITEECDETKLLARAVRAIAFLPSPF